MKRRKRNKYKRKIRAVKFMILLAVLILLGGTGSILAKYYSFEFRKGVAVASDIYFESDVLKSITVKDNSPDFQSFVPYVRAGGWSTTGNNSNSVSVIFNIMNYKSKLQYNQNLDIVYDVYAKFQEPISNSAIKYYLSDGSIEQEIKTDTADAQRIFSGVTLFGASKDKKLQSNTFTLTITPNGETAAPKAVYIWAVPTQPKYLAGASNAFALGAQIQFTVMQQKFSVTGKFDILGKLNAENAQFTEDEKNMMKQQSAFVYTISTKGEYTGTKTDEKHLNQVPVELSWNSSYLELDKFSKFLSEDYKGSGITTDTTGTISTMTIWLDAYSESEIVFYRANSSKSLEDIKNSYNDFKELVTFKVLGESTEDKSTEDTQP